MSLFVYTRGLFGPTPEKWPELLVDMSGTAIPHLTEYKLSKADESLSLDELSRKFPAPIQDLLQERPMHLDSTSRSNGDVA